MSRLVDAIHCMRLYRHKFRRFPNLIRPRLHTEKMQVAKLTWRSPLLPIFVDKVRAKAFIAEHFGADLVTPNLFVGETLPPREQRDWPLPYVIKANHGSTFNLFVRTEADRDWDAIEAKVDEWLVRDYGRRMGEWAYSKVPRRVLVEPFIAPPDEPLTDYKLNVFAGRTGFVSVIREPYGQRASVYYDRDWQKLPFTFLPKPEPLERPRPQSFDRMLAIAEEIGKRLPFVRVDFYEIDGLPRFSEITVYAASGLKPFDPPEYDAVFGAMWPAGKPANRW